MKPLGEWSGIKKCPAIKCCYNIIYNMKHPTYMKHYMRRRRACEKPLDIHEKKALSIIISDPNVSKPAFRERFIPQRLKSIKNEESNNALCVSVLRSLKNRGLI